MSMRFNFFNFLKSVKWSFCFTLCLQFISSFCCYLLTGKHLFTIMFIDLGLEKKWNKYCRPCIFLFSLLTQMRNQAFKKKLPRVSPQKEKNHTLPWRGIWTSNPLQYTLSLQPLPPDWNVQKYIYISIYIYR